MAVSSDYLAVLATAGAAAITHVALLDDEGAEIGSRQAKSWSSTGAVARPSSDTTFTIPAGTTVAGWKAFDAATSGTDFGGGDLDNESYTNEGTYTLKADQTSITHSAG